MKQKEAEIIGKEIEQKHKELENFIHLQENANYDNEGLTTSISKKRKHSSTSLASDTIEHNKRQASTLTEADLKRSSPWMPQFAPKAESTEETMESSIDKIHAKKPPKRPASPISGAPLKLKNIYPVDLERDQFGKLICSVSKKQIKYQQMVLITKSKKILTEEAFNKVVKASVSKVNRCPVTNVTFKNKDVIKLKTAISAFASKGNTQKTRFRPNMI